MIRYFFITLFITCSISIFAQSESESMLPATVIVKLKPQYKSSSKGNSIDNTQLQSMLLEIKATEVIKKFPNASSPVQSKNARGQQLVDLSLVYQIKYSSNQTIENVIHQLMKTGLFEYAVPHVLPSLLYIPNDAKISSQYYLGLIKAYEAWDVWKGDTNMVIGVTDTGTDIDHPDLMGNIKYNYADPIDGKDNDKDGFIDNFRGWDLGDNDNDPSCDYRAKGGLHGSFVSGFVGAETDNLTGMASPAFKCKFMPLKVNDSIGNLIASYESIVYAVEHGCKVVNCSWGSTIYSAYGQDVINYATYNHDALIVAAAGNDNNNKPFYPASYEHVLNVAATDINDVKWEKSSYGKTVDVSAPGKDVFSTWDGGGYTSSGGTSFASPIVAALAGLVRSYRPHLNSQQVAAQISVTTDNIDTITANKSYVGHLGSGRVNFYSAITDTSKPSVKLLSSNFPSGTPVKGTSDTLKLVSNFISYLSPAYNLEITLKSLSPDLSIVDSVYVEDTAGTMEVFSNYKEPFKIVPVKRIPPGTMISFKIEYRSGTYTAFEYFSIMLNVDFVTVDTGQLDATISSKSIIGYNDQNVHQGIGVVYKNTQMMSWGGLVIGQSAVNVSDAVYSVSGFDDDFSIINQVERVYPPEKGDFHARASYNDSLAATFAMKILVEQNTYAWANERFIINEYKVSNTNADTLKQIYIGQYLDWDMQVSYENRAGYDSSRHFGYVYSLSTNVYGGVKLFSQYPENYYAFNNDGSEGSLNIYDGFTGYDKFIALSNSRSNAGAAHEGSDVSQMISAGPITLAPGDTAIVAFALLAGDYRTDIQSVADSAFKKYYPDSVMSVHDLHSYNDVRLFPNPTRSTVWVAVPDLNNTPCLVTILDLLGHVQMQKSFLYPEQILKLDINSLSNGVYMLNVRTTDAAYHAKFIKADF